MSKIRTDHVFTSESVSEGHPDKVCDQVSDAVLDACLKKDARSRVACETLVTTNLVVNAGEITCAGWDDIDPDKLAREVVRDIGYDREELMFCADTFEYLCRIHSQSPDISQGVSGEEQGAGDQGMMFGYATDATDEMMPAPIAFSHRLLLELKKARNEQELDYLRPDAKSQVSVQYRDGNPEHITSVVISQQTADVPLQQIKEEIVPICRRVLEPTGMLRDDTRFFINPTGKFVIGGPHGDAGLTGRKIIVDTYGGVGSHGGGAFSGKDPSKVDRSAAYYSRYAAKNIVAAGLAGKCEIQVAYAIGVAEPLSINVDTYGTGRMEDEELEKILQSGKVFDFRPKAIVDELGLLKPEGWSYRDTAAYGHFGRPQFPWEKTDRVDALKSAAK
ncbi:methionine adenosyltransferase [Kiritimatiella glycovorans]|uniref:S-adenosylmethionine synthase n=1 Tax=Kiritimatiella glycovorans TaxID=1307763 RepID=A0A0G3EGX5_9BACT|nr:methionine adenosyltransferase [Kiritimatiella glycovorans]AKJ64060.1 S-adenosylmethionine synthase [Kiritimatiella glycovorans]